MTVVRILKHNSDPPGSESPVSARCVTSREPTVREDPMKLKFNFLDSRVKDERKKK